MLLVEKYHQFDTKNMSLILRTLRIFIQKMKSKIVAHINIGTNKAFFIL